MVECCSGHSDTSWSNGSSRAATDKDSGNHHRQHLQNSSKQQSSLNTSSAQDVQRTVDSSMEVCCGLICPIHHKAFVTESNDGRDL